MPFPDRIDAGRQLAERLGEYRRQAPMVVGVAWGGVAVARVVASVLVAPLDVLVAHHLHASDPEGTRFGAVSAYGEPVYDAAALRRLMLPPGYVEALVHHQRALAEHQEQILRGLDRRPVKGRTVILVDQGARTGLTLRAAMRDIWRQQPREVIVAAPVVARQALETLRQEADRVVALEVPERLEALEAHYGHLPILTPDDVRALVVHQVG